jgi:hypothetical protein
LFVLGGCSGDTGEGLSTGGGGMMFGGMKAFCPGHGVTALMQSLSIGAAANAASRINRSDPGSAAIADCRMHWTHSHGISFPTGCLKSLE